MQYRHQPGADTDRRSATYQQLKTLHQLLGHPRQLLSIPPVEMVRIGVPSARLSKGTRPVAVNAASPQLPSDLMRATPTDLSDVLVLEPRVFADERGWFFESFNARAFGEATGVETNFVQDNHSRSEPGVLRGLHYQLDPPQGKLVRCTVGRVFDVVVDIRRSSATFSRWVGVELSAENRRQLWIPVGFAHGFVVLDGPAEVQYKTTAFYHGPGDRSIRWDDPTIGIDWPFAGTPILSEKDASAPLLADAEIFE